jgi:hypothetical protein
VKRGAALWGLLVLLAAPQAQSQEPDAIDALLRPPPAAPAPPASEPRPSPGRPVFIHETGRTPDGPASGADLAYDGRLRSSAAAARSFQGPLEGSWTLAAEGRDLFALELVDRAGVVEGAWRDLRRPGSLEGSGLVDPPEHNGQDLTFRLGGASLTLRPAEAGWIAEITEAGRTLPAQFARRAR